MGKASRAVVASLVLIAVGGGALAVGDSDGSRAADDATSAVDHGRALVAALDRAWASGDAGAFADLAADSRRGRQATTATWRALRLLRVDRLDLRWVAPARTPAAAPPGTAAVVVSAVWTQPGWNAPARTDVEIVFSDEPGDLGLLGVTARTGRPAPLWAMAPLDVRRTPTGAVVVGLAGSGPIHRVAGRVEAAARQVATVLPDRRAPLSVVLPATSGQFADLTGTGFDPRVAGVTQTVDGSLRHHAAVHVLLNPRIVRGLRPVAMAVLLAHEITHVATGAAGARPLWVVEGFADLVALRGTPVPVRVVAGSALARVRHHGPPARLPTAADFAAGVHGLGRAYEQAWLAFRVLDRRAGTAATVRFHQAVVAGEPVGAALREAARIGVAELTRGWRRALVRLAGAGG